MGVGVHVYVHQRGNVCVRVCFSLCVYIHLLQVGEIMTDLGRTQHLHDRDDLMAEQVRELID